MLQLHKLEKKAISEYVALGFQQRASGLVVKTTCCVMYHCGSNATKIILLLERCRILIAKARENVWVNKLR